MSARIALLGLYQEWQELTDNEGSAIRLNAWQEVREYQDAKLLLQQRIVETTTTLRREVAMGAYDRQEIETEFKSIINQLIDMENRNREWLAEQRRFAELRRDELAQSARNLRQVHRAYVPDKAPAWNSYS
ncbi:MAG TPA: hypothetical protein P5186_12400 [Candidatus Paceibacterota bacterium]|nr:hypothetical protein [Verrucomicrobiota bacterium]HRY48842.1 hypothetical protein [Candidatus Paceibacterota bacterium]HSA02881.1 hypothetical protein [Candidatus Paceibacterota bacterium]